MATDPAVAIADAARRLEEQLRAARLEGHHPRAPRAAMPRWWTSGLASAALWGVSFEYGDATLTLLEGDAIDNWIEELGRTALAWAELGDAWVLCVEAGDELLVIKYDRAEDDFTEVAPLAEVLAAVRPRARQGT